MAEHSNSGRGSSPKRAAPTYREKGAVQRSVNALLDELAPEQTLTRAERIPGAIQLHRSPNGCVLQGSDGAVSVSWFADESKGATLGELHIIAWRGTVARRGATRDTKGATIASEMSLSPIEPPVGGDIWRATDGTTYNTVSLVAKCMALLQQHAMVP
jgi:hypothetical protein